MTTRYKLFRLTDPEVADSLDLALGTALIIKDSDKQYYLVAHLHATHPMKNKSAWWWIKRTTGKQIPGEFTEAELEVVKLLYGHEPGAIRPKFDDWG